MEIGPYVQNSCWGSESAYFELYLELSTSKTQYDRKQLLQLSNKHFLNHQCTITLNWDI